MKKDASYRVRLPSQLLRAAQDKARREDVVLSQVVRWFLVAWVNGSVELPKPEPLKVKREIGPME